MLILEHGTGKRKRDGTREREKERERKEGGGFVVCMWKNGFRLNYAGIFYHTQPFSMEKQSLNLITYSLMLPNTYLIITAHGKYVIVKGIPMCLHGKLIPH